MADTKTAVAREVSMKSKLVMKDLGNPKGLGALPATVEKLLLGRIIGITNKIVQRTMPTGEMYEGLSGSFEGTPQDASIAITRSGICYLPSGIQEQIIETIVGESGKESNQVRFAFDVYVIRSTNAAGYSWSLVPLVEVAKDDPLALLRNEVPAMALAAPEAPTAAKTK